VEVVVAGVVGAVIAILCIGLGWAMGQYQLQMEKEKDGNKTP